MCITKQKVDVKSIKDTVDVYRPIDEADERNTIVIGYSALNRKQVDLK